MGNNRLFSFLLLSILLALASCKKKERSEAAIAADYHQGKATIFVDGSFQSVAQALADAYMIHYPDTDVKTHVEKEDIAFMNLLEGKTNLVMMSRVLGKKEIEEYERVLEMEYNPAYFAADAVVFVVSKNSDRTSISVEELEKELASEEKNIIFDGANAGNLNFVAHTLGKRPIDLKFSTLGSNEKVIEDLYKYPTRIGAISLGTISRPYGKEAQRLREMVKILPVVKNNKSYLPEPKDMQNGDYPFTRMVYMLTSEAVFGIANGIMRFASDQKGQMVVSKEGLQPYYLFRREVEMR